MNIKIILDKKRISEEVKEVYTFLTFLDEQKIPYYFPFKKNLNEKSKILKQIDKDLQSSIYFTKGSKIQKEWTKNGKKIMHLLKNYCKKNNLTTLNEYKCFLSLYGPEGYYYPPDTIITNIYNLPTIRIIDTIVHELIHLLLYKKTKGKSHKYTEKMVEKTIEESGILKFLPNYIPQKI